MLTTQQQRDRLLAALENSWLHGMPWEDARALIAECRAEGSVSTTVDNRGAPSRLYGICQECGLEVGLYDEPPEAGADPDTAAVSGKERLEDR